MVHRRNTYLSRNRHAIECGNRVHRNWLRRCRFDIRLLRAVFGRCFTHGDGNYNHYSDAHIDPGCDRHFTGAGPVAGGTSVTITGTGFTGATAVTFGSTNATSYTVNSATSITATSPTRSPGIVNITITTLYGTSATSSADLFTYAAVPAVTGILPTAGSILGQTSVTITGTGFTGATAVTFGNTNATSYTVNSATSITATSPAVLEPLTSPLPLPVAHPQLHPPTTTLM